MYSVFVQKRPKANPIHQSPQQPVTGLRPGARARGSHTAVRRSPPEAAPAADPGWTPILLLGSVPCELKMLDPTRSPRTSRSMAWSMVDGRLAGDCPCRAGEAQPPPLSLLATAPCPRRAGEAQPPPLTHRVFLSLLMLFNTTSQRANPAGPQTWEPLSHVYRMARRGGFDLCSIRTNLL